MTEGNETIVKHVVFTDPTYANAHAISGIAIEARLRAVWFIAHNDWMVRRGVKRELLWQRGKRSERITQFQECGRLFQFHADRSHVAVADIHTMTLRAYRHWRCLDLCAFECAKNLLRLLLNFFFFTFDERQHVVANRQ